MYLVDEIITVSIIVTFSIKTKGGTELYELINVRPNAASLLQAKGRDAGHTARKCFDQTIGLEPVLFNRKIYITVPRKPQFKKTVSQGLNSSIE